jgi:hypothetical protein
MLVVCGGYASCFVQSGRFEGCFSVSSRHGIWSNIRVAGLCWKLCVLEV